MPLAGKKTSIKRISSGSIPANGNVVVSYDFISDIGGTLAPYSYADSSTVSYFDNLVMNRTMTILKPDFICLSLGDENRGINRDSRSKKLGLTNAQMLAKSIIDMDNLVHSYSTTTKMVIWDDMVSQYHNGQNNDYQVQYGGQVGGTQGALNLIPKDLILAAWWYDASDYENEMHYAPLVYNNMGFKSFGSTWTDVTNIKEWSYIAYKDNLYGMFGDAFSGYPNTTSGIPPFANYSWNAVKSLPGF